MGFPIDALRMRNPSAGGGSAPYGTHIGWRIYSTSNILGGASSRTSAGQIEFKDSGGGTISTAGATIFEGGTGTANSAASNAFDGSPTTGSPWSRVSTNGGNGCYIGAVFGSAVSVAQFRMYSPTTAWAADPGSECIMSGKLQYSDDTTTGTDGTWTDAFSFWEPSWSRTVQNDRTHPQDTTGGKYKAYAWWPTLSNDGAHMAMDEAEIYVGGGSMDQCTSGRDVSSTGVTNPLRLFDNLTTNWTELGATNRFCGYGFPDPIKATGYSLNKSQFLTEAWKNWTFKGSNDGSSWTTVDTQTGQTWASASTKTYGPF